MDTLIGKTLSHYRIIEKIGAGGMGEVYRAHDERLKRDVALKVLPLGTLADEAARKRFRREALALSKLDHPNIATVHDFDTQDGVDFLVMEYVAGETLEGKLLSGPLSEKELARLGVELAEGLAAAHGQGVIHRDLKPGNVRLTPDGRVKILDFGLAKLTQPAGTHDLTQGWTQTASVAEAQALMGTLPYMAPEQLRSEDVDARSDLWAAGLVLYELATGHRAFPEVDSARLVVSILAGAPDPPSSVNRRMSARLDSIVAKCLEKDPEHRYQSAKELAVDLRRLGVTAPGTPVPGSHRARRARWVVFAGFGMAIALGLLGWNQGWLPGLHSREPHAGVKAWILVAEFDGPAADSSTVAATRDLVIAALDQSEIVMTVPRDQVRVALEGAGKPVSTRVDAEVARELAYRSAVRTVLEGRMGRLGKGYSLVLRVVDADSARVVASVSDVARSEQDLIPTVSRIGKRLRAELGERKSAIQATRVLWQEYTPSFGAYKLFVRGITLQHANEQRPAITVLRSALALDPNLADAWGNIGICFANLGEPDSAIRFLHEALARPERLSEGRRLHFAAQVAFLSGDPAGALALQERVVELYPQFISGHNNRAVFLSSLGRPSEGLEGLKAAERVSPFGPSQILLGNRFNYLLDLGRVDEARALIPRLKGRVGMGVPTRVAAAAGQWSAAESLAMVWRGNPAADDEGRAGAGAFLAAARASRGQVGAADQILRQDQSVAETARETPRVNQIRWTRLALTLFSGGVATDPGEPGRWGGTSAGLVMRGLWAAAAGDTTLARRLLATIRKRSHPEVARLGFTPAVLEAWIAARAGRWQEVLDLLGQPAMQGEARGYVLFQSAPLVRWLVAEAYERLDRPDSAAAYFERAIALPAAEDPELFHSRMAFSFVQQRLVLLYARMGRLEEAKRHWRILTETVRAPDPEIRLLIAEARAALLRAEQVAAQRGSRA